MPHPGNEHSSSRVSFPTHCTLSIQISPVPLPNAVELAVAKTASVKFSILERKSDTNSGFTRRNLVIFLIAHGPVCLLLSQENVPRLILRLNGLVEEVTGLDT